MSELTYGNVSAATRDRTHTLFAQTMGYVAVTTGFFALGAYLGRNLSSGWAFVWYIVGFVCLIAMNFTVKRSAGLTVVLLFAVGLGLGSAPPRCSSPGSVRPAMRPGGICPRSPGYASGPWWPSSCSASC